MTEEPRYFLRSERLGFRPWSAADVEPAMGLWGDPEVTRSIGGPFSREQVQGRLALEVATMEAHGIQYRPMFLLATGEHVGSCGLRPHGLDGRVFEIGFHVRRVRWGRGYAEEAVLGVMGYVLLVLGAMELFAGHNPANEASRRLAKLGFRYTHDEYYASTGLQHPSYLLRCVQSVS